MKDAGNLEWDTIWGLRVAARYLERPELLAQSAAAARHFFHRDLDLAGTGLPFKHGPWHRHGGLELGHFWWGGLLAELSAAPEPGLWPRMMRLVEDWLQVTKGRILRRANCRSVAWSLLAAAQLQTLMPSSETEIVLDLLLKIVRDAPGIEVPLFDSLPKSDGLYKVSPWVNLGILGEALQACPDRPGREAARNRFHRAARFLSERCWNDEGKCFKARFIMHPEAAEALSSGGRMTGEEALFFALGLMRARAQTKSSLAALEAMARQALLWGLANLKIKEKKFRGKELSQLLWLRPRLFGLSD